MNPYKRLSRLFPTRPAPENPGRIVLIRPCCIGDVMQATAALKALRRGYPQAQITFAVGGWSKRVIEHHDCFDAILDTGPAANPAASVGGMRRFVAQLRAGDYDMAVSLVRSPLMSVAVWLSRIPDRVGLDSAGRGFGYTLRVPVDPAVARPEAEIYLDVVRALGIDTTGCFVNVPVRDVDLTAVRARLLQSGVTSPYLVVNPAGGGNPGMTMASKRWPPEQFAALIERVSAELNRQVVLLAGPDDGEIIAAVQTQLESPVPVFLGELSFGEIAGLAQLSSGYIGNDTGLTHLAAATGVKTIMILGPSDPVRYAPFTPNSLALWQPSVLQEGGVAAGVPKGWTWDKDGIGVDAAVEKVLAFLLKIKA
jgi:ADP-heptose:LPS heptosyltransferase